MDLNADRCLNLFFPPYDKKNVDLNDKYWNDKYLISMINMTHWKMSVFSNTG